MGKYHLIAVPITLTDFSGTLKNVVMRKQRLLEKVHRIQRKMKISEGKYQY